MKEAAHRHAFHTMYPQGRFRNKTYERKSETTMLQIRTQLTNNRKPKPDENSRVGWFGLEEAVAASTEPWFQQRIYKKLNAKLLTLGL